MAARYKGKIRAYQIWNEANLAREWDGKAPNAKEYVDMLRLTYQAIKKADPNAVVINGGLSPTTAGLARSSLRCASNPPQGRQCRTP